MIIEPLYCLFARKNYDRSPIVGFVSSDECVRSSSFEKNEKEMIKRRKKKISLGCCCAHVYWRRPVWNTSWCRRMCGYSLSWFGTLCLGRYTSARIGRQRLMRLKCRFANQITFHLWCVCWPRVIEWVEILNYSTRLLLIYLPIYSITRW